MLQKIKHHYLNGTLFDAVSYSIFKNLGIHFAINKLNKLINIKHRVVDIPNSKADFEFPEIKGHCVVYGSAPTALIPVNYKQDWNVLTANSSQFLTDQLGLKNPDLSLVCTTTFYHGKSQHEIDYNIGALKALQGKKTQKLIMLEDKICNDRIRLKRNEIIRKSVDQNQLMYNSINFLSYAYRYKFAADVLGDKYFYTDVLSTGFFTALFAFHIGGSPIIMSGFSFSNQKHGYPDEFFNSEGGRGDKGRGELTGDLRAIEIILKNRWPFYAAEKQFAKESGLPYWSPKLQ